MTSQKKNASQVDRLALERMAIRAKRGVDRAAKMSAAIQQEIESKRASAERIRKARDDAAAVPQKRPKDMTPQERADARRKKLVEAEERARRKDLAAAQVSTDTRTAAGQREYDVRSLGGSKQATVNRYQRLFAKGQATPERLAVCERFDDLCYLASEGLFPNPKFEPAVDNSLSVSMPEERAAGLWTMDRIRDALGYEFLSVLHQRIHMGMTYAGMEAAGGLSRHAYAALFVLAVDRLVLNAKSIW